MTSRLTLTDYFIGALLIACCLVLLPWLLFMPWEKSYHRTRKRG